MRVLGLREGTGLAVTRTIEMNTFLEHDAARGSPVSATTESRRVDDSTSTRPTPTEVQPELRKQIERDSSSYSNLCLHFSYLVELSFYQTFRIQKDV